MRRRTPRTELTEEERALWRRVAETTRPLVAAAPPPPPQQPPRTQPPPSPQTQPPQTQPPQTQPPQTQPPLSPKEAAGRSPPDEGAAARAVLRPSPPPERPRGWTPPRADRPAPATANTPGLDRGTARRLGRGRIAPQARLDLHGMTADRAHTALGRFIAAGAAGGLRCVLVVTGKGRGETGAQGEGVLRRDAPRWLATPPLAAMVIGVFEAHQRHGGGGALYVYLKRRR